MTVSLLRLFHQQSPPHWLHPTPDLLALAEAARQTGTDTAR